MARRKVAEKKASIEITGSLLDKLQAEANRLGIDIQTLARMKLAEAMSPARLPPSIYPPFPGIERPAEPLPWIGGRPPRIYENEIWC